MQPSVKVAAFTNILKLRIMDKQNDGLIADILLEKFTDFEKTIKANRKEETSLFSLEGSIQKISIVYYGKHFNYQFNLLMQVEAGNCSVATWVEKVKGGVDYAIGILNKYPAFIHTLRIKAKSFGGLHTKRSLGLTSEEFNDELFA